MEKDISIIISTYNSPDWLANVLYGYNTQTYRNFEVIIADDGSDERTKNCINKIRNEVFYPINHVWHEDNGFQKTIILNKSILATTSEYIIMTDGDCIPREDFIEKGSCITFIKQTTYYIFKCHIQQNFTYL